jgi:hypothetical protein
VPLSTEPCVICSCLNCCFFFNSTDLRISFLFQ